MVTATYSHPRPDLFVSLCFVRLAASLPGRLERRDAHDVSLWQILLQNSAIGGARQDGRKFLKGAVRRSAAIGQISSIGPLARQRLGGTRGGRRRGSCDKFGKPA